MLGSLPNRIRNESLYCGTDPRERLIAALDVSSAAAAQKIVAAVGDSALTYKVGMQLYTAEGPQVVRDLVASGRRVFLDLKYHDIPNTVGMAVTEAVKLGVSMLTVHASGSDKMLLAAVDAAKARPELMVLAVTVLTSMGGEDLEKIGLPHSVEDSVLRLADLALACGCQGIVTSAREAKAVRASSAKISRSSLLAFAQPAPTLRIKSESSPSPSPRRWSNPHRSRPPHHRDRRPRRRSEKYPQPDGLIAKPSQAQTEPSSNCQPRKRL